MNEARSYLRSVLLLAGTMSLLYEVPALAGVQRAFVASNGSDAAPCSIIQPCRSFAAAVAKTNDKGEVIVLDSAGYGAVTISQSVSIIAPPGIYAGISVFSGIGVDVEGTNIHVVLRGLTINGQGGSHGILFIGTGGSLLVDGCNISDMTSYGLAAGGLNAQVRVRNSVVRNSLNGVSVSGSVAVTLAGVHISGGLTGVYAASGGPLTIVDSVLVDNQTGVTVTAGTGSSDVMVSHSSIADSDMGFYISAVPGFGARLVADANSINNISDKVFKMFNAGGPMTVYSPGNNSIGFNNGIINGGSLTTPCCLN